MLHALNQAITILKESLFIPKELITSEQIRAARAFLRWSASDLANSSGVSTATIKRLEVMKGTPAGQIPTLTAIKQALEAAGIEFVGSPEDAPGVRLKTKR